MPNNGDVIQHGTSERAMTDGGFDESGMRGKSSQAAKKSGETYISTLHETSMSQVIEDTVAHRARAGEEYVTIKRQSKISLKLIMEVAIGVCIGQTIYKILSVLAKGWINFSY